VRSGPGESTGVSWWDQLAVLDCFIVTKQWPAVIPHWASPWPLRLQ